MTEPRTHAELEAMGKRRPDVLAVPRKPEPASTATATAIADALESCTVRGEPIPIEDRLAIARHLEPWWHEFAAAIVQRVKRRVRDGRQ